jgi:hypothetical protein
MTQQQEKKKKKTVAAPLSLSATIQLRTSIYQRFLARDEEEGARRRR